MLFRQRKNFGYGQTQPPIDPLTGKQQVQSQGLDIIGQGLQSFFGWKTAQAQGAMQPSQGGGYYTPMPNPEEKNYTPVIVGGFLLTSLLVIGTILVLNKKGKKK